MELLLNPLCALKCEVAEHQELEPTMPVLLASHRDTKVSSQRFPRR